jgi:glycosyltransferase involved in cell wall biosynthesis
VADARTAGVAAGALRGGSPELSAASRPATAIRPSPARRNDHTRRRRGRKYDGAIKLLAFTDYVYRRRDGVLYGERAFSVFLGALAPQVQELTLVGRLDPEGEDACRYPLPDGVHFVPIPHYASLTAPLQVASSLARSLWRFWRALDDADRVWLLGPYPHALAFAVLTLARRRRLILGVRQDFPAYVRSRRPTRHWMHRSADVLEGSWQLLARRCPVVVVGAQLAEHYAHAPAVLDITVSLISAQDVARGREAAGRDYDRELTILSVGRVDHEKNPLLLADVLERLRAQNSRWRLVVAGEGALLAELQADLARRGLTSHAELLGYVPVSELLERYRSAHVFLHVSLTEGVPQVLIEAFASGLPVVATDVGGVRDAVGDGALLIGPADAPAAVAAVARVADEPELRARLIEAGLASAERHTLQAESARVVQFIERPSAGGPIRRPPG